MTFIPDQIAGSEPQIVIAASDALLIQRTLVSLIDGGALRPLDREIARQALAALERGEVLQSQEPKCLTPALDQQRINGLGERSIARHGNHRHSEQ